MQDTYYQAELVRLWGKKLQEIGSASQPVVLSADSPRHAATNFKKYMDMGKQEKLWIEIKPMKFTKEGCIVATMVEPVYFSYNSMSRVER